MELEVPALDADQSNSPSSSSSSQQQIDSILDECLRYSARRPIMRQFDPASRSIWRQWRGTVVSETWKSAANHAFWAIALFLLFQNYPKCTEFLDGFNKIWSEVLAVTTFTLTFFVNEAYGCWRNCLNICYNLQGRMNDLSMVFAGCAKRVEPNPKSDPNSVETTSKFTPESRKILNIIARYIRVFNILSYASFTRSHRPLLTPQGMRRMVRRGLLTEKERAILVNSRVSNLSAHNEVLVWMFRMSMDAHKAGHFEGGNGFEQSVLLRVQEIRAQGNYMQCILQGRMPFGYAHIVQVLVDLVSWLYPVMAYSSGASLQIGILGSIVLTMMYQGLFDLAKRFLDPFHNESFWSGHDPIRVDTLIAETNAGSRRWMFGLEDHPIPFKLIQDGGVDLDNFILPDEGYTTDEVAAFDAEMEAIKAAEQAVFDNTSIADEIKLEEKQAFEEEFAETQAIMSAPPGADFVPGIDDKVEGEDEDFICTTFPDEITDAAGIPPCDESEEIDAEIVEDQPPSKVFDQFLETVTEEYEEALRQDLKGEIDGRNSTEVGDEPLSRP